MRVQLVAAFRALVVFTILAGVAYPLAVTGVAQVVLHGPANGSLIKVNGQVVGSRLLGQAFDGAQWFQPRPSAAGDGYDASASAASNLGPTNPMLLAAVAERADRYRADNGLDQGAAVPVDAVTASASGLDPHISVANARLQAPRVAASRGIPLDVVTKLIDAHVDHAALGFLGEDGVNVVELNLALGEQ